MIRTNWTRAEIADLFDLPFTELVFRAAEVQRAHHAAREVQLCTLLSIKTGGCPEDCGYCSQSAHAKTELKAEKLTVDFACLSHRLVVEVDGNWHGHGDQPRIDEARDAILQREGSR